MKIIKGKLQCPKCKSMDIHMIEYMDPTGAIIPFEHQYDGISEYRCNSCNYREGRWSGRELKGNDFERKYGDE